MLLNSSSKHKESTPPNYSIGTNSRLQIHGKSVEYINDVSEFIEIELKTIYKSTMPFSLEIGLIDNWNQRAFEMKESGEFFKSEIFSMELPATGNETKENIVKIRVDKLFSQKHDLLFFIKNSTLAQGNSIRPFHFVRLAVNPNTIKLNQEIDYSTEIPFLLHEQKDIFLEIDPFIEKNLNDIYCELQYNINKIYDGENFVSEYESHKDEQIDFAIMVLEDGKLLKMNGKNYYAWSKSKLGENGKMNFFATSNTSEKADIAFIIVPYPYLNIETEPRYKLIAYNNICYYNYKFNATYVFT